MLALDVFVKLYTVRADMNQPDLSSWPQKSIHSCLSLPKTIYEHCIKHLRDRASIVILVKKGIEFYSSVVGTIGDSCLEIEQGC